MDGKLSGNIVLENREKLYLYGVTDSECFDDTAAAVITNLGRIVITGKNLHLAKLSLETEEAVVEGLISSVSYVEKREKKNESLLTRLFR